ncbi:MAG: bifunctional tetrahydrofolate synthase/dihydrofolate synthase [Pseudomonadota bacterium]|nr:bifunctional tetrahydrofolate synthase/dihydrofolate synthase [Pseudomonadota bacterium]MDP1905227.1 bifunctional tetrahydrofolate synthase/dihydrofolate synthase [Pseudomonadota bacterium]MDP2352789.1 bifunctional tetrahydrofolate synthase/dihydrofolate synthase [Pseudomonadota bacterium]
MPGSLTPSPFPGGGGETVSLAGWLAHLEARNVNAIVLGLDRVRAVADRLALAPGFPLITVGGTNGKGSVCAYLEAMLAMAGYRVGCYTSPHLLRYNERVRVAGNEAGDADLCRAFAAVESARGSTPLTYFEQGTLAALWLFQEAGVDVAVLEVGLGGRLDAVNLWDADCAVVSSVDLDHQAFLGDTRELIGFEKAGIYRGGRPAICGDPNPPASLLAHAADIGAEMLRLGPDLRVELTEDGWNCRVREVAFAALPRPAMPGAHQYGNAACAIAALHALRVRLPVPMAAIRAGIAAARQPGRFQVIGQAPLRLLDVAHNPHAARALAANLANLPPTGKIHAVFAMLADKDVDGVIGPLVPHVDFWHVAGLSGPRGLAGATLAEHLAARSLEHRLYDDVAAAWQAACRLAVPADTIAAFGSFHTVAEAMRCIQSPTNPHG